MMDVVSTHILKDDVKSPDEYDEIVYGIGWELYNEDYTKLVIEYEQQYRAKMTMEDIQDVKSDYDKLSDTEKAQCTYYILTRCTTTYDINTPTMCVPFTVSKELLELFFHDGNERPLFGQRASVHYCLRTVGEAHLIQLTHLRSVVTKSPEEFGKPPLAARKLGLNVYS